MSLNLHRARPWILLSASLVLGSVGALCLILHFVHDRRLPLAVLSTYPNADEVGVAINSRLAVTFNKDMPEKTVSASTFILRDNRNQFVPAVVAYEHSTHTATLSPSALMLPGTTYHASFVESSKEMKDSRVHQFAVDRTWRFTTGVDAASSPVTGPGGPILLITGPGNGFSQYYAEILRNEGFNEFDVTDISTLTYAGLQNVDLVLLGEIAVTKEQAHLLSNWVLGGGTLITMRPDKTVARIFDLRAADNTLDNSPMHDAYIAINSSTSAGAGLVRQPIQFHGEVDQYHPCRGTTLALVYKNAQTATPFPAVCLLKSGRGNVVIFSYDLARSVVYTRQGNPDWSGQERDGISPIRSDDLFYGASVTDPQPDWVDQQTIAIPQADEQQRLLGNIITITVAARKPLPHFWYLPRGFKAAIVMTGDDHGSGGTAARFKSYLKRSPAGCSVQNWECIRGTSYVYLGSIASPSKAAALVDQGFEIGVHVYTKCMDWPTDRSRELNGNSNSHVDRAYAESLYDRQFSAFAAKYPGVPAPVSSRIDCVTWGDYDTQPQVELSHGVRFDTNYYYWPPKWVGDRPGLFTGSGMPMRFAKRDGSIIDVYQAATQMTDESKQSYPFTVDTLLSNALGTAEYFGVFTVNMHNDHAKSAGADAVIAAALSRHVPVVTAAQMLNWLDGRNASSFQNLTWSDGQLGFTIAVGTGGNGIQALLPMTTEAGSLTTITVDGVEAKRETRTIAGLSYAAFSAAPGRFVATYRRAKVH